MKNSGAILLQIKRPESIVGTVNASVKTARGYIRIGFCQTTGVLWMTDQTTIRVQRDLAVEMIGIIHVLLASIPRLEGGADEDSGSENLNGMLVMSVGRAQDGILECHLGSGTDAPVFREEDGMQVVELSARRASDLISRLAQELGRIAAWYSDQP